LHNRSILDPLSSIFNSYTYAFRMMRILFFNPFHGGSHAAVAEGYARHSRHAIGLLTLSIAGGWRWRMRGAAVTFARMLRERMRHGDTETRRHGDTEQDGWVSLSPNLPVSLSGYDLILATDMLDLATFLALTRDLTAGIPTAVYFHENQLTYPLPAGRVRDLAFPWTNYTSALAADAVLFNSDFHRRAFLDALPGLAGRFHDHREPELIAAITAKAHVLTPGIDLARLDEGRRTENQESRTEGDATRHEPEFSILNSQFSILNASPIILWNSRWEYDKAPEAFFDALSALEQQGVDFRVIVLGEHVDPQEPNFLAARERLASRTLAWGYAPDAAAYRELLHQADIVVSTAVQEFFGIGVIEAMYCGCVPILPRRLSYPEILPPEHHAACLYDGPDDLVAKLRAAIHDLPALKARDFRTAAAQHDWRFAAPRFDEALEWVARQRYIGR
jgi:glycosyltransferase involved in cell wall biosynthesis